MQEEIDFLSALYEQPVSAEYVQQLLHSARDAHLMQHEAGYWRLVEGRLAEWAPQSSSALRIAVVHYILSVERVLQNRIAAALHGSRRDFFQTHWLPYLLRQTRRMKEAIHDDTNLALQLYSDSLREAWLLQRIDHVEKDVVVEEELEPYMDSVELKKIAKNYDPLLELSESDLFKL
jgi:hypothetical protein